MGPRFETERQRVSVETRRSLRLDRETRLCLVARILGQLRADFRIRLVLAAPRGGGDRGDSLLD
jgi:hypothetical protein